MAICDVTFSELRVKDVVNICDCKKIGRVIDVVIDLKTGIVKGIIVPGSKKISIFRAPEDLFIPWRNILRIGNDVILIEIAQKVQKTCSAEDKCDDDIPKNLFKNAKLKPKIMEYSEDE